MQTVLMRDYFTRGQDATTWGDENLVIDQYVSPKRRAIARSQPLPFLATEFLRLALD